MKRIRITHSFVVTATLFILFSCGSREHVKLQPDMTLWYEQPATQWTEALPVGNGRLGAMVFGDPYRERIQLNEESLWAGAPMNNNNPEALENLPLLRQLLFDKQVEEAQQLVASHFIGTPPRIRSYQTAGDLFLTFDSLAPATGYQRSLCLETGIAACSYVAGDVRFTREVFASAPANALFISISSSQKKAINLSVELKRERDAETRSLPGGILLMTGQIVDEEDPYRGSAGRHMQFAGAVRAFVRDGQVTEENGQIIVKDASDLMLVYTAATNYDPEAMGFKEGSDPASECLEILAAFEGRSWRRLKQEHISDHASLFNRVQLDLGGREMVEHPTDRRLERVKEGASDPHLVAMLFQYGRYLLMGSSRSPGVLPANLQGIWNHLFNAPWNSDFHTNINLQMNYWPAEITNLPETVEPLTRFMNQLSNNGVVTAREMYGARGWTFHHLTDPFGSTGVMDGPWGLTPMCGPWMTFPLWRHYAYNPDEDYLRRIWPLLSGSAEFILDFLVESPVGYLVTNPSHSPENTYFLPATGRAVTLTYGATIDIQIAREVLENTIEAALLLEAGRELVVGKGLVAGNGQLNADDEKPGGVFAADEESDKGEMLTYMEDLVERCKQALDRLPPVRVGADGTIMEWIEDYEEPEPGHRHMSHLLGLYPLHQINPDEPALFEAAAQTIEKRLRHGGGHTGWSRAWIISFYSRLFNSEKAYENLVASIEKNTLSNLFSTHPPFQIDGNFGNTAGIAGMLLGSAPGVVYLLPALPDEWQNGSVTGLRAHGGLTLSMEWDKGALKNATIRASKAGTFSVRYKDGVKVWTARAGEVLNFQPGT